MKNLKIKSREKGKNFMRWFTSDKRVLEMPDVVQICMRGKNEHLKVYIQAL